MSYDMMVFDPGAAPRTRDAFLAWYQTETTWSETHRYDDPVVTTPALRAWFDAMAERFPPMNGPFASGRDGASVTDYSVGTKIVYAAFAWSVANEAREAVCSLAARHGVGVFDVSSDEGRVLVPEGGALVEMAP